MTGETRNIENERYCPITNFYCDNEDSSCGECPVLEEYEILVEEALRKDVRDLRRYLDAKPLVSKRKTSQVEVEIRMGMSY